VRENGKEGTMREWAVGAGRIELLAGDITRVSADAIVNAANAQLAGGAGVDGAIHRAGGPAIREETRRRYPDGCPTGGAVVTGAGNLPSRWVIHAVAPVWRGGQAGEPDLLRGSYATALTRAAEVGARSIAFPSLGTGIYGNPLAPSARIALEAAASHLLAGHEPSHVMFVLFGQEALAAFEQALEEMARARPSPEQPAGEGGTGAA
jgi:O-acetyl-ADP-ribose deacetylase (regulator of RNase III)